MTGKFVVVGEVQVQHQLSTVMPKRTRARVRQAVAATAVEVQRRSKDAYLTGPRPIRLGNISGRLRRSINVRGWENDVEIGASVGTNVEYAAFWELGFDGTQQVRAHERLITMAFGRKIKPTVVHVGAHPREVHSAPRPFLRPPLLDVEPRFYERMAAIVAEGL